MKSRLTLASILFFTLNFSLAHAGCDRQQVEDLVKDKSPELADCYHGVAFDGAYGGEDHWSDQVGCENRKTYTVQILTKTSTEAGDCRHPLIGWYKVNRH